MSTIDEHKVEESWPLPAPVARAHLDSAPPKEREVFQCELHRGSDVARKKIFVLKHPNDVFEVEIETLTVNNEGKEIRLTQLVKYDMKKALFNPLYSISGRPDHARTIEMSPYREPLPAQGRQRYHFKTSEDMHKFEHLLLGWRIVAESFHVGFKLHGGTQSMARVQIWQENLDSLEETRSKGIRDPLPFLLFTDDPTMGRSHHYVLLEPGLNVVETHRSCHHTDTDVAACQKIVLGYAKRRGITSKATRVSVHTLTRSPYDQERAPTSNLLILKGLSKKVTQLPVVKVDYVELHFETPIAKHSFAECLTQRLVLRDAVIQQRQEPDFSRAERGLGSQSKIESKRQFPLLQEMLIAEGFVPEEMIGEGVLAEDLIAEGLIAEGLIAEGLIADGLIAERVITAEYIHSSARQRNSMETMSTMSIPAPPYALSLHEDSGEAGSP